MFYFIDADRGFTCLKFMNHAQWTEMCAYQRRHKATVDSTVTFLEWNHKRVKFAEEKTCFMLSSGSFITFPVKYTGEDIVSVVLSECILYFKQLKACSFWILVFSERFSFVNLGGPDKNRLTCSSVVLVSPNSAYSTVLSELLSSSSQSVTTVDLIL